MIKTKNKLKIKKFLLMTFLAIVMLLIFIINPVIAKIIFNDGQDFRGNTFPILIGIVIFLFALSVIYLFSIIFIQKRITDIILNTSLVFFSIFIILIALEFIIRISSPPEPEQLYAFNNYFNCVWHKPNLNLKLKTGEYDVVFKTNNIGLRDNDEFTKKDTNEIRIMDLGDSFIQAAQVNIENTMTYKLEGLYNTFVKSKKVTVINAGTSLGDPLFEKEFLQKNIYKFELDYLFYFIYIGNDILTGGEIIKQKRTKIESLFMDFLGMLREKSKLINYIFLRLPGFNEPEFRGPLGRPTQPFDEYPESESANILLKLENRFIKKAYKELWIHLSDINNICKDNNVELIVFIVPTKEQVDKKNLDEVLSFYKLRRDSIDLDKPQRLIASFFTNKNVKYCDLLDTLREANAIRKTYFDWDSHWNEYGNDIVTNYIFNRTINMITSSR